MTLYEKLYESVLPESKQNRVGIIQIGLSYTAVTLDSGGCGIAFTFTGQKTSCSVIKDPVDYEGKEASILLEKIFSDQLLERSIALALINAVNSEKALRMPEDTGHLFSDLRIKSGSRVYMVGYFGPVIARLNAAGAKTEILDNNRDMGEKERFYKGLRDSADALILTSTSIINNTAEEVLGNLNPNTPSVLMGPSTPVIPEAFRDYPVTVLAGSVPVDTEETLKSIRNGRGTPVISRSCRKIYSKIQ